MISVRLEGRLGNQLFQYAFIYAAAKKLGVGFYLDKSIEPFLLPEYFKVKHEATFYLDRYFFSIKGFKNVFTYHLRVSFYKGLQKIFSLKEVYFSDQHPTITELSKLKDKSINIGFFQSEQYFLSSSAEIRDLFVVHTKFQQQFNVIIAAFPPNKQVVTVHVRRTDYLNLDLTLSANYYHKAIESIHSPDNFYVFVSDDPDFIEAEFKHLDNKYVSRNTAIVDLQLLMNAEICILANSSFSWWGAYLNSKNAKIIAPRFWSGQDYKREYPADILMKEWTLADS